MEINSEIRPICNSGENRLSESKIRVSWISDNGIRDIRLRNLEVDKQVDIRE